MHTQIMQICPTCLHIIKLKIRLCLMFPRALMMYVVCSFVCLCGCAFTRKWHPVEADWSTAGVLWLCYLSTVILHEQTFYTHKPHTHTHKSTDTHTHTHSQLTPPSPCGMLQSGLVFLIKHECSLHLHRTRSYHPSHTHKRIRIYRYTQFPLESCELQV